MENIIYVDSQAVILLDGATADVNLEYNENTEMFEVTVDCENWADDIERLYDEDDENKEWIHNFKDECKEMSGKYETLKEINKMLEEHCEHGSWYEFTWEYDDGTPVE